MLDQARALKKAIPFRPFRIVTGDGQQHLVASPRHVSIHPNNSRAIVWVDDHSSVYVMASNITALELVERSNQPIYPAVFYSWPSSPVQQHL